MNALAARARKIDLKSVQRIHGEKVDVLAWADPAQIESVALDQLRNVTRLPWVFHHVAAMPDVHYGKGATVGSVIAMKGAISPAAVGVDIGCGVAAVRSSLTANDLPDSLHSLRSEIERAIPVGFEQHKHPVQSDPQLWRDFEELTPAVRDLESQVVILHIRMDARMRFGDAAEFGFPVAVQDDPVDMAARRFRPSAAAAGRTRSG